jgi:hypothetical protein
MKPKSQSKSGDAEARRAREAAALRTNLLKRKQQQKLREAVPQKPEGQTCR